MHKSVLFVLAIFFVSFSFSQSITVSLATAVKKLEAEPQMKHALLGFQVVETSTGQVVYANNAEVGLGVASSQKVFTAAAALSLLGKDFRYKTELQYNIGDNGSITTLLVKGDGDPTLGSWRFPLATDSIVLKKWVNSIKATAIKQFSGGIQIADQNSGASLATPIPEGYIWQDIGNYYGAGTSLVNWHENQYDLLFKSRATGDAVTLISALPDPGLQLFNLVKAGKPGSGDNAYIFSAPYARVAYISGTIPPDNNRFSISGSLADPARAMGVALRSALLKNDVGVDSMIQTSASSASVQQLPGNTIPGSLHTSPPLDSIVYWFLRKSINLYGEALVKTIANVQGKKYDLEEGLTILKDFWMKQGIEKSALNIRDGSGLSPTNRVTVTALVKVMQYAKRQAWFDAFYDALPEFNGIKMKSGTITGVKSFTGYVKSKSGKEYCFAIVINNYDGTSAQSVQKMYTLLNILK